MPEAIPWAKLRIAVAALAMAVLFLAIPPSTVLDAWREVQPDRLALGMAWMAAAAMVSSAAFYATLRLRGIAPPLGEVVRTDLAGHFYTFTAPFGVVAGGAARVLRLQRPGRPVASLIGAILANRLINISTAAALACLALLAVRPVIGATWPLWLLPLLTIAGLALAAYLAAHNRRIRLWAAGRLVPLLPLAPQRRRRIRRTLRRLGGAGGNTSTQLHLVPVALVILRHLCSAAALVAFAAAFGLELGFVTALWVRMALNVAMLVPLSPAGLGVREVGFVILLHPFAVPEADALAIALCVLAYQITVAAIGGLCELSDSLKGVRATPLSRPPATPAARSPAAPARRR